jgi:hypothetical protein
VTSKRDSSDETGKQKIHPPDPASFLVNNKPRQRIRDSISQIPEISPMSIIAKSTAENSEYSIDALSKCFLLGNLAIFIYTGSLSFYSPS